MQALSNRLAPKTPWLAVFIATILCGLVVPAWAQNSAATVMSVSGTASAIDAQGRERPIAKGADVYAGDKVVTAGSGLVQMRLHDGGYISVRPGTEMVIDQFVHNEKDASKSSFLVSLLRGGFRSITGLIGRTNPSGYQIRTATATVGIRGTDHEPMLILDTPGTQSQDPPPGLYDKVNEGETFIRNQSGILALKAGDVGFSPMATDTPPQVLLKIPNFYRLQLRIDTSDAKDAADGKPDGAKRRPGAVGDLLRPSVAARREALSNTDGKTAPVGIVAPVTGTTTPVTAPIPVAPTTTATTIAPTTPLLTTEQKKTIVQTLTTTPQKTEPVVAPTTPLTTQRTLTPLQK